MEKIDFEGVNLAELLPRIPDSVKNGLPFGIVRMDLTGIILEYNMAEGELTGIDPKWAIGKNFFNDVAICTKTQAFYGRFLEGVKKGFLNAVFEYVFDNEHYTTKVKVHMFTMPDSLGNKTVMLLVKRSDKPLVIDAIPENTSESGSPKQSQNTATASGTVQSMVNAVVAAMNQDVTNTPATPEHTKPMHTPTASKGTRHEDILKF